MIFDAHAGLTAKIALFQVGALLSIASLIHSLEFLSFLSALGPNGIWRGQDLAEEAPFGRRIIALVFDHRCFAFLQLLRIAASFLWFFQPGPLPLAMILFVHLFTVLRFRGSFNGGSDSLTLYFLLIAIAGLTSETGDFVTSKSALWGISAVLVFSYFRAGLAKISTKEWRQGIALKEFLVSSQYEKATAIDAITKSGAALKISSWILVLFELTFPLAFISPSLAYLYICAGVFFHLANGVTFGLNRFLFAWISGYPALLYCAS